MKKLLVTIFALISLVSSTAFAKTEGSYAGLDLIRTSIRYKERFSASFQPVAADNGPNYSNSNYGAGLNYKYAFNFNNAFIAPGLIFEYNNTSSKGDQGERLGIRDRYGVKADLGYDVTEQIAPYFTVGYSNISYSTRNYVGNDTASRSGKANDWFYGAGLKFDVSDKVTLNLEYNTQKFKAKATVPNAASYSYAGVYRTKFEALKLGVSYKF
jgi:outer membrane autotransporter protein